MASQSPPSQPLRAASPLQPTTNGQSTHFQMPPEKRPKLSHGPSPLGPRSPVNSVYNSGMPYSPQQWSPHTTQTPALPPQRQPPPPSVQFYPPNPLDTFNQPQPVQPPALDNAPIQRQQTAGAMGPPEKPQKPLDPNDITDMVALSGVDLRAEDEYLAQSYLKTTSSFDTQPTGSSSQGNSFGQWSQGNYGSQPGFQPGAPFNQQPATEKSLEEELREKHKRAARAHSELQAAHLRNPFLASNVLRDKIHRRAYEEHVRFDTRGLQPHQQREGGDLRQQDVRASTMTGPDGRGIVTGRVALKLETDSPVVEVLTLLSLACNERLRTVLEDAYSVSRARQHGSQGIVPPEWSNVARASSQGEAATAASLSITNTSWEQNFTPRDAVSVVNGSSRPSDAETSTTAIARLPTPPTEPSPQPQAAIAYKSELPPRLISLAERDLALEKARLAKRRARQKQKADTAVSSEDTATPAPGSETPAPVAEAPKITKKALAAEKKAAVNEEVQRKAANLTASMALGGKSKKYAWLTGAKSGGASSLTAGAGMGRGVGSGTKSGSTPGTPGPSGAAASGNPVNGIASKAPEEPGLRSKQWWKKMGDWREDGPKGRGVQIRDIISVLDRDGQEKKTLAKCLVRLKSDEKER